MSDVARWRPDTPATPWVATARFPRWDLLLVCVAAYIAVAVGRVHQLFPLLSLVRPALLATVLSVGLYLLQQSGQRRLGLLSSPTTVCLVGLLVWGGLSVPFALNQGVAFQFWIALATTVCMALVIAGSVRRLHDLERLCLVYFAVAVVYTLVVLSRFQLGAESWRLGRLYYYDANDLATFIVSAMPLGLHVVLTQRRLLVRAVAGVGLAVLLVGLIRSGSRGGFLAFLAVAAFMLLGFTAIRARTRLAGVVVMLGIIFGTASDRYWTQMQTLLNPDQDYNLTSDEGRMRIWKRGFGYMVDHAVVGIGGQNFPVAEGTISPQARLQERGLPVRWGAAHNSFVQAGAELGIPGFLLFLGLFGTAFASLRRIMRRAQRASPPQRDVSRLAQSLTAALVGFVVGAFFLSLAYADLLYTLIAMTIGLAKVTRTTAVYQ